MLPALSRQPAWSPNGRDFGPSRARQKDRSLYCLELAGSAEVERKSLGYTQEAMRISMYRLTGVVLWLLQFKQLCAWVRGAKAWRRLQQRSGAIVEAKNRRDYYRNITPTETEKLADEGERGIEVRVCKKLGCPISQ